MNLYKDIMFGQSPLKRYQREMMAIVVSSANQCEYCLRHHSEALFHFWKDENKVNVLIRQPDLADLNDEDTALCQFAWDMIVSPELFTQQRIDILKTKGLSDRSVLVLS